MTDQNKFVVPVTKGKMTDTDGGWLFRDVHNYVWKLTPTKLKGDPLTMQVVSTLESDDAKTVNLDPLERAKDTTLRGMQTISPKLTTPVLTAPGLTNQPGQPHNPAPNAPQPVPVLPVRSDTPAVAKNLQPLGTPRADHQDLPNKEEKK